jgi:hypothetical protein
VPTFPPCRSSIQPRTHVSGCSSHPAGCNCKVRGGQGARPAPLPQHPTANASATPWGTAGGGEGEPGRRSCRSCAQKSTLLHNHQPPRLICSLFTPPCSFFTSPSAPGPSQATREAAHPAAMERAAFAPLASAFGSLCSSVFDQRPAAGQHEPLDWAPEEAHVKRKPSCALSEGSLECDSFEGLQPASRRAAGLRRSKKR